MFIRIYDQTKQKELLVNLSHASLIEVQYAIPTEDGHFRQVILDQGIHDERSVRCYTIHVAGQKFLLEPNLNSQATRAVEEIYKNAFKD